MTELAHLKAVERQLLWLACWMIHNANHLRPKDEVKVGGHQASCASMVSIMTALYFHALRPQDRVAVKPHASPVFHAMQYLMGNEPLEKLQRFRGLGGAQSYPSRTKDTDDVDFSTGSVGLGVAITAFASLVQDYLAAKEWSAAAAGPHGRAGRRCRTRRGQHLRVPAGGLEARPAQLLVGHRLQPPVARRRRPRGALAADRGDLRRLRLARRPAQVRRAAARRLRRAGRRRVARLDRPLPEPAILRADLPGRRRLAQAADGRDRRPGTGDGAARPPHGRRAGRADDKPRRPLRRDDGRGLRRRRKCSRPRPADLLPRLYDQGLGHAARRPQGQPFRPDDHRPDGDVPAAHGRGRR